MLHLPFSFCSTCIDIANNSVICTDYRGNGSYLNYTTDIDIMLLESDVIDYIESNIASDQCREFLMVAVCTIIYPVCTEIGTVKRLCSEECALNEKTCAQEVTDVSVYLNEWLVDPAINFTINCSNSLDFVERYLESSVCYDDCFSMSIASDSDNSTDNATSVPLNSIIITTPTTPLPIPDMYVCCEEYVCYYVFSTSFNRQF